ncbi:MAG: signal peptide peptidase SppA [Muribaculaceae bacterium]|nr:signal peptide peptidase SppA [Muribaculaceae bacterium]MBR5171429.1 signal peptide peptidase SppA [Muribaculaceae bacterium]
MLKKFFLIVCGSFVGSFLALIFFTITAVLMSFVIFSSMSSSVGVKLEKNSILYLRLDGELNERPNEMSQMMAMIKDDEGGQDLNTLIKSLKLAKDNENIDGVYLDCRGMVSGMSSLYELRNALVDFKKSQKFVYAFGDEGIMQSDYYLASVADSIFLNPEGAVDVHGLGASTPYFKNLLDKVGVEMQIVRVGTFKSAVEPFMLSEMSDANREQQEHYLGSLWGVLSKDMAESRKIAPETFKQLTDSVMLTMGTDELLQNKIVDHLCYRTEMEDKLRRKTDVEMKDDLRLITPSQLVLTDTKKGDEGKQIAVVYATGEIDSSTSVPGMSEDGIDSESLAALLRELQYDDNVKGLVLRVNSPGGSAFGSEVIWKAIEDFKKSGKPVAVSMSDYAASGGYYISAGAQRIFAEPTTITGSIGIFGMVPNASNLINNTLGVKFEEVSTNKNAIAGAIYKPLTEQQKAALQRMVEHGYDLFTHRCAVGRNVSQDSIKSIAEGRVWDGITAKNIGLVDEFGGLQAAIDWVAKKANLGDDYSITNLPEMEMSFKSMLGQMTRSKVEEDMQRRMGIFYTYYEQLQAILSRDHVQCLMEPVEIDF